MGLARTVVRTRAVVQQAVDTGDPEPAHPLGDGLDADPEGGRSRLPRGSLFHMPCQRLSTAKAESGILMNVHSVLQSYCLLVTNSFSGSNRMDNLLKDHRYPTPPPLCNCLACVKPCVLIDLQANYDLKSRASSR